MIRYKIFSLILLLTIGFNPGLYSQQAGDRQSYAAGRFYESDSAALQATLKNLFNRAQSKRISDVLAIISPHAGYVYSGEVAAQAFKQLDPDKKYKNIFIIGSSHTTPINGASIYSVGDYITPLGKVKVNKQLANELISQNSYISFVPHAHKNEHILENQLPFLQYYLNTDFNIIPVSIGTQNEKVLKSLANTFAPYLNEENLFVISADFSHYPVYKDAQKADSATAYSILTNSVSSFDAALKLNDRLGYPGLVTSTCGSSAIKMLLYITENDRKLHYHPLMYQNSGDAAIGNKNRVVGYFALALAKEKESREDFLTLEDKVDLLQIARSTIEMYLENEKIPALDPSQFSDNLLVHSGAFVTLNKNHKLRGCIGRFKVEEPVYKVVQEMAIAAATQDYRFPIVSPNELDEIEIEISVLTPLRKINTIDEIELGRDGIYIVKGSRSGTFLPQVATDTGWNLEEFLGHCSRDKAGIGWNGWKDAEIYIYQAMVFEEFD